MRAVAVEHAEEPVEGLCVLRERLDDFEAVLVNLRSQHMLQALVPFALAAVPGGSRGRQYRDLPCLRTARLLSLS